MDSEGIISHVKLWIRKYSFPTSLVIFQSVFIVLYGVHARYHVSEEVNHDNNQSKSAGGLKGTDGVEFFYPYFQDVHIMMFIGFGFLMTFLRRYSFSSVSFNFLIAAFVLEWAILIRGYSFDWNDQTKTFLVDVKSLLHADYVCAAILISFGAVLGKTNPAQLIVLALIEVVIQVWNEYLGLIYFCVFDAGESIFVHVFGAYFGLAVSFSLQGDQKIESEHEGSNYASDIFSMIGTLFLFCFWPSFNAGAAVGDARLRAIINTYISISASVVLTFVTSAFVGKGKKEIVHIQNATLAGGVAIGTISDKNIGMFGAMIVGSLAGIISTLGYKFLLEGLKKIRIHDTCGVNNLHGMPGIISGLAGIIVAIMPSKSLYQENLTEKCYSGGTGRSTAVQVGFQCAALVVTLAVAIVGGLFTGIILRLPIFSSPDNDSYFDDSLNWHVPHDFHHGEKLNNEANNSLVTKNHKLSKELSKEDFNTIKLHSNDISNERNRNEFQKFNQSPSISVHRL